ncbi:hypothetical protein GOV13_01580 [Candidatus Pacearchaeota archaeon]|nr:hypothetical protein [Candidatus Pacearchaeota archaeon]
MNKKRVIIITIILIIISVFLFNKFSTTGKSVTTQQVEIVPLSSAEKAKVQQVLSTSEFVKDVPKKESISLRFYDFESNQRIWQDGFLIGTNQEPAVNLILHSKYISELNNDNLCEVIKKANQDGDLGFQSEFSKPRLLLKYAGMLKHRKCFGF